MAAFKLKKIVPTEKQEHLSLMQWIRMKPYIFDHITHIANEYDGGVIGGMNRKRMGVKKGVSDFFLAVTTKSYSGLWIELKRREGSVVSFEQQAWIEKMNNQGYKALVCYGFEDAIKVIESYIADC